MTEKAVTQFVDWPTAIQWLWANKANGKGSSSSFRGVVNGKKYHLVDDRCLMPSGQSSGEVIVKWLRSQGATRRPANNDNRLRVSPPRFSYPGVARGGCYIDIRAAYPSIYRRWEWDAEYLPDKGVIRRGSISLEPLARRLMPSKFARNALVGFALSRRRMVWRAGLMRALVSPGGFFNPSLGWFCWAVLSWAALKARDCGARYFNTDGAIFNSDGDALAWSTWLESVGLDWSEKGRGDFIIWGLGSYSLIKDGQIKGFSRRLSGVRNLLMSPVAARRAFDAWRGAV